MAGGGPLAGDDKEAQVSLQVDKFLAIALLTRIQVHHRSGASPRVA